MKRLWLFGLLLTTCAGSTRINAQSDSDSFRLTQQIGRGTPNNIEWQPGSNMLLVNTMTGAWLYTDNLEDIAHIEDARLATFSPSGCLLAGVDHNNHITMWDMSTFEQVNMLSPHSARIIELEWSPEGDRIASLDEDGHIVIWRPDSHRPMLRMRLPDAIQIAWSREGTYLAATTDIGRVSVWDAESGWNRFSLSSFCPSPCYAKLLWRNDRQILRWRPGEIQRGELWDVPAVQMILQTTGNAMSTPPTYNPDGTLLAWGPEIQDGLTGERIMSIPGLWPVWSKDGTAIASNDFTLELNGIVDITVFSMPRGNVRQVLHDTAESVRYVTWNDAGDRLAGVGDGLKIWRVSTGETLAISHAHSGFGQPMAYNSDGSMMAITGDRAVHVWDTQTGESVAHLTGFQQNITLVRWQPAGTLIAISTQGNGSVDSIDNIIRIWDSRHFSETPDPTYTYSHDRRIQGIAWSPDGTRLASVDTGGLVRVWDANDLTITLEFDIDDGVYVNDAIPSGIEWSFGGNWLRVWYFSSGNGGGVALWNASTGEAVGDFIGANTGVTYGWTSDDELLSAHIRSSGDIGAPRPIFEIPIAVFRPSQSAGFEQLTILETLPTTARKAQFHPSGDALVVIDDENTLWVWDIPDGYRRFRLPEISKFVWNPDGTQLIVWRDKTPAQIVSARDGTTLDELDTCFEGSAIWSPAGNQIACAAEGVLYLWEK